MKKMAINGIFIYLLVVTIGGFWIFDRNLGKREVMNQQFNAKVREFKESFRPNFNETCNQCRDTHKLIMADHDRRMAKDKATERFLSKNTPFWDHAESK